MYLSTAIAGGTRELARRINSAVRAGPHPSRPVGWGLNYPICTRLEPKSGCRQLRRGCTRKQPRPYCVVAFVEKCECSRPSTWTGDNTLVNITYMIYLEYVGSTPINTWWLNRFKLYYSLGNWVECNKKFISFTML